MKSLWHQLLKIRKNTGDNHICIRQGFTILEMVISTAIILFISGQVLISFSNLKEASTLTRAAQEFAFNIRRAQNMSVSVVGTRIGGTMQIPNAVGLRLSSAAGNNDKYFFFADQPTPVADGKYTGDSERIEPNILLPGNIKITSITGEAPAGSGVHIIFYTPEAMLLLSNNDGTPISNFVNITLTGPSGDVRRVRVRISGQVTVL